jgi:hypothetical protein
VAWRLSVMSSVLGACAAALLHATVLRLTGGSVLAGCIAGFGFAFSPTPWLYSIQAEVFGLNNCLCALVIALAERFFSAFFDERDVEQRRVMGWAYAGAFACGLAMTNQHTTVFPVLVTVLAVVALLFQSGNRLLTPKSVVMLFVALFGGMSPYLYLPFAASQAPMDSWGDQTSLAGFVKHFFRVEYGTFQLAADGTSVDPGMVARLLVYVRVLHQESLYVVPTLALIGGAALLVSKNKVRVYSGVTYWGSYVLYVAVFHYLANLDLTPLFLGVQVCLCVCACG